MENWKLEPAHDHGLALGERFQSLQRESGLLEVAAHLGWWVLVRTYLQFGHRLKVIGRENLPQEPPFVLIANHTSHLDALVLASLLPARLQDRVFPIAAGDTFFETPLKAAFAAGVMNTLPIWRRKCGPHAMKELRQRLLDLRCVYALFPEGTRSRDGQLLPFKPGLGMLIAETEVPVVPCYLAGAHAAWPANRTVPQFRPITLRVGRPMVFADKKNVRAAWEEIATAAEQAVRSLAGQHAD